MWALDDCLAKPGTRSNLMQNHFTDTSDASTIKVSIISEKKKENVILLLFACSTSHNLCQPLVMSQRAGELIYRYLIQVGRHFWIEIKG